MKYIRTKDGVYELKVNEELKAQKTTNYFYIQHKGYGCNLLYDKQDLKKFKQADTIEELCDTFVIWDSGNNELLTFIRHTNIHFKHFVENAKRKVVKIYGAIWTDKGLIYVAKMNDKGELELL